VKPEDLNVHANLCEKLKRKEVLQLLKYGNIIAPLAFRHQS